MEKIDASAYLDGGNSVKYEIVKQLLKTGDIGQFTIDGHFFSVSRHFSGQLLLVAYHRCGATRTLALVKEMKDAIDPIAAAVKLLRIMKEEAEESNETD